MKPLVLRVRMIFAWAVLATSIAAIYGVVNDQITLTLSPEYFSVFKRRQFFDVLDQCRLLDASTRIQAVLVGVLATWWFGLGLGIILGAFGTVGQRQMLPTRAFLRAVSGIIIFTFVLSMLFGAVAYAVEPIVKPNADQWPFLEGIHDVRDAFAIGWWHDGAYLGGVLGTVLACGWVRRWRQIAILNMQK